MKPRCFYRCYLLLLCSIHAQSGELPVIQDIWISEPPPGVSVNAGYFLIENRGTEAVTLTSVKSPVYNKIEIHQSIIVNGVVKMQPQPGITIPARQRLEFRPGDHHLMLFDPQKILKEGESVNLNFEFADGMIVSVNAEIRKLSIEHIHR